MQKSIVCFVTTCAHPSFGMTPIQVIRGKQGARRVAKYIYKKGPGRENEVHLKGSRRWILIWEQGARKKLKKKHGEWINIRRERGAGTLGASSWLMGDLLALHRLFLLSGDKLFSDIPPYTVSVEHVVRECFWIGGHCTQWSEHKNIICQIIWQIWWDICQVL